VRWRTWAGACGGSGTPAASPRPHPTAGTAPRLTLGSNGAAVAAAAAGLGVTLVSRDAVTGPLADGRLVQVTAPPTPLHRPWHAVTAGPARPSAALLVRHLLDGDPGNGDGGWTR
jgi:DNA-binding transcriptional LysR family regulator